MSYSRRERYSRSVSRSLSRSRSPSPYERGRSYSRSRSSSRSRSYDSSDAENLGNNLYVTGLSTRTTKRELEKHFASEGGKVLDSHLVVDPRTRESRGFGFVTMSNIEEADRCIKYLDRSVLGGRVITVEKFSLPAGWLQGEGVAERPLLAVTLVRRQLDRGAVREATLLIIALIIHLRGNDLILLMVGAEGRGTDQDHILVIVSPRTEDATAPTLGVGRPMARDTDHILGTADLLTEGGMTTGTGGTDPIHLLTTGVSRRIIDGTRLTAQKADPALQARGEGSFHEALHTTARVRHGTVATVEAQS